MYRLTGQKVLVIGGSLPEEYADEAEKIISLSLQEPYNLNVDALKQVAQYVFSAEVAEVVALQPGELLWQLYQQGIFPLIMLGGELFRLARITSGCHAGHASNAYGLFGGKEALQTLSNCTLQVDTKMLEATGVAGISLKKHTVYICCPSTGRLKGQAFLYRPSPKVLCVFALTVEGITYDGMLKMRYSSGVEEWEFRIMQESQGL